MKQVLDYLKQRDAYRETKRWLEMRNYLNPLPSEFALNHYTKRLKIQHPGNQERAEQDLPLVLFLVMPDPPWEATLDFQDDDTWRWFDPNSHIYSPSTRSIMPGSIRPSHESLLAVEALGGDTDIEWTSFLSVNRNGVIQMGQASRICRVNEEAICYLCVPLVGYFWVVLQFASKLYEKFLSNRKFTVVVCLRKTDQAFLAGLADGWKEPIGINGFRTICHEPNLQFSFPDLTGGMPNELIERLVKMMATELDNAWGQRKPRCYIEPSRPQGGQFDIKAFSSYSAV